MNRKLILVAVLLSIFLSSNAANAGFSSGRSGYSGGRSYSSSSFRSSSGGGYSSGYARSGYSAGTRSGYSPSTNTRSYAAPSRSYQQTYSSNPSVSRSATASTNQTIIHNHNNTGGGSHGGGGGFWSSFLGGYVGGSLANHGGGGYAQPVVMAQPVPMVQQQGMPMMSSDSGVVMAPVQQDGTPMSYLFGFMSFAVIAIFIILLARIIWWLFFKEDSHSCRHDRW